MHVEAAEIGSSLSLNLAVRNSSKNSWPTEAYAPFI